MKKILYSLALATTISLTSVMSIFALPNAENADTYTWILEDEKWILKDEDGSTVSGFVLYNDDIYYLDKKGIMKTGWVKTAGAWYYLDEDGKLVTDEWIDNYYVDSDGKMSKIE